MNSGSDPQKQKLVFLPGVDGTGRLLYRQSALFARYDVRCESYPQDRPQTYRELAQSAAENLRESRPEHPAIVLAESFGGAVALTLALENPELVDRLVLVNTFAYFPKRLRIRLGSFFGPFLPKRPPPRFTRPFRAHFFFSKDVPKSDQQEVLHRTADVPLRAYGRRLRMIAGLDLRSRLREVTQPALVLAAPDDRVVPPSAGRLLAEKLPNATLIEPTVGHVALVHPEIDVAELLAEWPA